LNEVKYPETPTIIRREIPQTQQLPEKAFKFTSFSPEKIKVPAVMSGIKLSVAFNTNL
jgi:hypothetical protein